MSHYRITIPVPCGACQCRENQEAVAPHALLDSRRSRSQTAADRRRRRRRPAGCRPSLSSASNRT